MPKRVILEPPFANEPFRVPDALLAGITRSRLRSLDLERPFHGIRSPQSIRPGSSAPHLYAPALRPGDRFSHVTAASLWSAPLPESVRHELHVMAGPGLTRPRGRGVTGHEGAAGAAAIRSGLPCSDPATTFLELTTVLSLDDLVAVGDHLVLDPRVLDPRDARPYVTLAELRGAVQMHSGRGARLARQAAALIRPGAESRPETLLRLLVHRANLPEPLCGAAVQDALGAHIGWFDLVWPQFQTIAEYDGDQHRTSTEQYDRDITRFDRAADAGRRVIRVRSRGLFVMPEQTLDRIRGALALGGWSPNRR